MIPIDPHASSGPLLSITRSNNDVRIKDFEKKGVTQTLRSWYFDLIIILCYLFGSFSSPRALYMFRPGTIHIVIYACCNVI